MVATIGYSLVWSGLVGCGVGLGFISELDLQMVFFG